MNKKVISAVMAGAMAVSTMGVVASASSVESTQAFTAKAGLKEFTITATIPAEIETFINPYGAQVKAAASVTGALNTVGYSDGLISPVYSITNGDANTGIKVSATAKITPSSTVAVNTKLLDDAKLQKATEKQVFAFLNTTKDAVSNKPVFASTKYVGNDNQLVFTEDGAKAAGIMTLGKSGAADKAGYFYVGGQCTPNPETAWDSKDTITIDLIFDLSPSAGDPADLSLASITTQASAANPIEKEFDGTKTAYTVAAKGSKDKYAEIVVTAKANNTVVYAKFNGVLYTAASTKSETIPDIAAPATASTTAAGAMTVKPKNDGTNDLDYAAGDVLEFIVVDAGTNESTTYTITFE